MPNVISYLIKEILNPKKDILLHLFKDEKLGEAFINYFSKFLTISIEKNIEEEITLKLIIQNN